MVSAFAQSVSELPEGCRTTPLNPRDTESPLRAALVVKLEYESDTGPFVRLRNLTDGSVFLGCLEDAGGRIFRWLEIWVQGEENLKVTRKGYKETVCNYLLDLRWKSMAHAVAELDPEAFLETGWEEAHPPPLYFEPTSGALFHPMDPESGACWELCTEDARLTAAKLPPYSTSLARYLVANGGEGDRFVPVSDDAPTSEQTDSSFEIFGGALAFNPGGLMLLRILAPLGFEEWIGLLSGKPWAGLPCGRRPVRFGGVYRTLSNAGEMRHGSGHLFLGSRGTGGRLLEAYHLKLQSIASAFRLVKNTVKAAQLPLLNLRAESFGVRLRGLDTGLPILWAGQTTLEIPGDAVALPVATTEARYFVPSDFGETSIYRPAEVGVAVKGLGEFRIRRVLPESGETTRVEASLVTQERLRASRADLLWIDVPLTQRHVGLYGHIECTDSGVLFRSEPQKLEDSVAAALRQAEGAPLAKARFEVLPILSTPCDLYALGVLAVRALLVDATNTLPVALDEIHSVARLVANKQVNSESLAGSFRDLAGSDARWIEALGPHRLVDETIDAGEALAAFPAGLWWETLWWIIRLFPGIVPESFCRDYADAPAPALESIFTSPLAELDRLLVRSRSMIVSDAHVNREIRAAIATFLSPSETSPGQ